MNKNNYLPLYLGIAIAVGIVLGSMLNFNNKTSVFKANSEETKIKRLINYIQYDYVDDVNTDQLLDGAINHIVGELDPHSAYFTKEEYARDNETMQGNFVGIGVQFTMHEDSVVVTKILKNGPSESVGIKAGDRIILADRDTLFGVGLERIAELKEGEKGYNIGSRKINKAIMKSLKGEDQTEVNVTIYRPSEDRIIQFPLTRGEVAIKSITGSYMLNDTVGYIKLELFSRTSYDEFKEALTSLQELGMKKLVFDLRGNPGGYMDQANSIIDEFLEDDKLIVFTKNKRGQIDKDFATEKGDFEDGEVIVLINENSASASEIVAGALQDNDKGTIVGRRSFGKGLVQQTMELGDGSALRLTTSRYYTPTGRSIQKPYNLSEDKEYYESFYKRYENGELINADSIKVNDSLKFTTPKGKIVYGGGGIVPDVFVSIDTTRMIERKYFTQMNEFVFNYIDKNREELRGWSLKRFNTEFKNNNKLLNEYLRMIDIAGPISDHKKSIIERYLKESIAEQIFSDDDYSRILNKDDKMINEVMKLELTN